METLGTKVCTICKAEKLFIEFSNNGSGTQCKACRATYARSWRVKNPDKAKDADLKKNFGIGIEQYQNILRAQGGVCAICLRAPGAIGTGKGSVGSLAVDHSHTSVGIRGLLCTNCNLGLGSFFENSAILRRAADYLDRHEELVADVRKKLGFSGGP